MPSQHRVEPWLVAALLGILVVWGVALRLSDPLSTRALAAEDPYTHIVFTREWMDQGYFADSWHLGTSMYPPGMHAFVGAFAAISGVSLYHFARLAPAILGGLAILGTYALASRLSDRAGGLAAAFLVAIMPEHIFRSELLFPTAFDLALLPLWLLAFVMMLEGDRVPGATLFAASSIPLAIMHPWAVPLLGGPLAIYAALRAIRVNDTLRATSRALALPIGLLVAGTAFAMAFRWQESDTGFADFLGKLPGLAAAARVDIPGPVVFAILLPLLGLVAAACVGFVALVASLRLPRAMRLVASVATGAGLLALLYPLTRSLPLDVDYGEMLGPIALATSLVGFGLAFVRPTKLGDLGVALALVLFPLTALDLFGSPFWPQRTVAYLAIGVGLLGANVAAHLYEARALAFRSERARSAAAPATLVALALVAAGAATAMPVDTYQWYRLYEEDEFRGFERAADVIDDAGASKVFVFAWQPALMVKTLADPDHVWYSPGFFSDGGTRATQLDEAPRPAYVLVDSFTEQAAKQGKASLGFLRDGSQYRLVLDEGIKLYEVV